jgi:hypothetical protein
MGLDGSLATGEDTGEGGHHHWTPMPTTITVQALRKETSRNCIPPNVSREYLYFIGNFGFETPSF